MWVAQMFNNNNNSADYKVATTHITTVSSLKYYQHRTESIAMSKTVKNMKLNYCRDTVMQWLSNWKVSRVKRHTNRRSWAVLQVPAVSADSEIFPAISNTGREFHSPTVARSFPAEIRGLHTTAQTTNQSINHAAVRRREQDDHAQGFDWSHSRPPPTGTATN